MRVAPAWKRDCALLVNSIANHTRISGTERVAYDADFAGRAA